MKIRLADYIVQKLVENDITQTFSVVGGGAMNLNDAFGHDPRMNVIYNHHEQACSIAAEGYSRVNNKVAAVCVTTGPGGTNALTGVVGAYVDSIPMIVISGQVRWDSFSLSTGLPLRAMGDQEFNIVDSVKNMTKYAVILKKPSDVRYVVEKAIYIATHGRKGPVWIDIPGDVQSAIIETDDLEGYDFTDEKIPHITNEQIDFVINKIKEAKRPVVYAGSAIRLSDSFELFRSLLKKLNVPVVTAWNSTDIIENDDEFFAGRAGNFGDRYGNFAVQNSDLILSIGCRLSIRQTGFNYKAWARNAFVIMVDIDKYELQKPTIHVEYPIHGDAHEFIDKLNDAIKTPLSRKSTWIEQCKKWIEQYPVVTSKHYEQKDKGNAYAIIDILSRGIDEDTILVSGNGTACVVGGNAFYFKKGVRFIENSGMASMGYDLPAAIGACIANDRKPIICLTGDGSLQMNLQELQTIVHHNLPIKLLVLNNDGYHSIRQSQTNFFKGKKMCGVGPDSSDLSFPDLSKLAYAYGITYFGCTTNDEFKKFMEKDYNLNKPYICEIFVDKVQFFQPKAGSMKLADGSMVSAPLEDLVPYLDREELEEIMKVGNE